MWIKEYTAANHDDEAMEKKPCASTYHKVTYGSITVDAVGVVPLVIDLKGRLQIPIPGDGRDRHCFRMWRAIDEAARMFDVYWRLARAEPLRVIQVGECLEVHAQTRTKAQGGVFLAYSVSWSLL